MEEFAFWPTYIIDLLFLQNASPDNILNVAAFFYGHGVPLGIASRVYICNDNGGHIVPYIMGGF